MNMSRTKQIFHAPHLIVISALALLFVFTGFLNFLSPNSQAAGNSANNNPPSRLEKISPDLRDRFISSQNLNETVSVILQLNDRPTGQLNALLNRNGVHLRGNFASFNSMAVELPLSVIDELALFEEVEVINADNEMRVLGHVTNTTGTEQMRTQTEANGSTYKLDGTGVGTASLSSIRESTPVIKPLTMPKRIRVSFSARILRAKTGLTIHTVTARTSLLRQSETATRGATNTPASRRTRRLLICAF